jgi:hypothetical protein
MDGQELDPKPEEEFLRVALTVAYAVVNSSTPFTLPTMYPSDPQLVAAQLQWDVERFADHIKFFKQGKGVQERVKEELERVGKYIQLPETERHCDEPQTMVDVHGRILVWSLPGILCAKRVVSPPILFQTPDSESGF